MALVHKSISDGNRPAKLYNLLPLKAEFPKAKKAKINPNVTLYNLCHSFSTQLLEDGVEIRYIQELLGHVDIDSTMLCTRVKKPRLERVRSPINCLFDGETTIV